MKMLLIADDFTGALDTGVKLAQAGLSTAIITPDELNNHQITDRTDVIVVNTETRHIPAQAAYDRVYQIVKKVFADTANQEICYYKKTDSLLRGNVGAELKALMDATQQHTLSFAPAFPGQMRTTFKGIQYLAGIPIDRVPFDPYEPVGTADITQVIAAQCDYAVELMEKGNSIADKDGQQPRILVFDAETNEDLRHIGQQLASNGLTKLTAGCAGFAAVLPEVLKIPTGKNVFKLPPKRLLFVCGSINPVTQAQIGYAQGSGFDRFNLAAEMPLKDPADVERIVQRILPAVRSGRMILDTNDLPKNERLLGEAFENGEDILKLRREIVQSLGRIVHSVLRKVPDVVPVFAGGDTLAGFLSQIEYTHIIPVCEVMSGCVLSTIFCGESSFPIVSKSGAFGDEDLFMQLVTEMEGERVC